MDDVNYIVKCQGFSGARNTIEAKILLIAKKEFAFNFSLVFYDVTTLYFESFEVRRTSAMRIFERLQNSISRKSFSDYWLMSKDFPWVIKSSRVKRFEGHTLIPIILRFKRKHKTEKLTVVGDAAMISGENIEALTKAQLQYIVGAE